MITPSSRSSRFAIAVGVDPAARARDLGEALVEPLRARFCR